MSTTFFGAVFDATDAARAAAFWSDVLGRPVNDGATAQDAAIDATTPELGPRLAFHRVPEAKTAKNRFHPDLITSDLESETSRLLSLGAKVVNELSTDTARWTTFTDQDGNEFDLIAG
jgi:predicted enzyme related to lactoylglutathione lyase